MSSQPAIPARTLPSDDFKKAVNDNKMSLLAQRELAERLDFWAQEYDPKAPCPFDFWGP